MKDQFSFKSIEPVLLNLEQDPANSNHLPAISSPIISSKTSSRLVTDGDASPIISSKHAANSRNTCRKKLRFEL